ncbi:MAG: hypothetical protein JETT_3582 [Candidatus Jettenia ecosi]|uniref:DUF4258 domain-containing protein n=1 Tax=Candidatus Jettenia ecosi TaxID=2494326 RepID=A0A533Q6D4_9BACT|nr:MAG: hypothetical protein JETT_3582 [Candidatus Jettenia ecosi]
MKLNFSRHAKRRMKWRGISEEDVYFIVNNPDKIEESIKGRTNAYKSLGKRYIKVTYKKFVDKILIISAVDKGV